MMIAEAARSAARNHRSAGLRERGGANAVAGFEQSPCRPASRFLRGGRQRQPREKLASRQVMMILVGIDDVAIQDSQVALSRGFKES